MELLAARQRVIDTLLGWGQEAELIGERLLLRDRHYVGRRFEHAGGWAVWLFDADEIKFYNSDREFLTTVRLVNQEHQTMRRAA